MVTSLYLQKLFFLCVVFLLCDRAGIEEGFLKKRELKFSRFSYVGLLLVKFGGDNNLIAELVNIIRACNIVPDFLTGCGSGAKIFFAAA